MDPTHYEKIADKLMQFRGKLPKDRTLSNPHATEAVSWTKRKIDDLLVLIDNLAKADDEGWIR